MSNCEQTDCKKCNGGSGAGKLYAVGIGPGAIEHRTRACTDAILDSDFIVGYTTYINLISDLIGNKTVIKNGMREEVERVKQAIRLASDGYTVSLISSGDAGVYGMAGLVIEIAGGDRNFEIKTIPGVTAANCAASALGAPLMLDYAVVSLSDLLVPWEQIEKRLNALAQADMVVALYNPRSKKRVEHLNKTVSIFKKYRRGDAFVGVVTNAGCPDQTTDIVTLDTINKVEIGMRSLVILGNDQTSVIDGLMIQPRGYVF